MTNKEGKDKQKFSEVLYDMFKPELQRIVSFKYPYDDELYRAKEMINMVLKELDREGVNGNSLI